MIIEVKKGTKAKLQKYFGGITHAVMTMVKFVAGGERDVFNFNTPITSTFNFRADTTTEFNYDAPITETFNFRSDI